MGWCGVGGEGEGVAVVEWKSLAVEEEGVGAGQFVFDAEGGD